MNGARCNLRALAMLGVLGWPSIAASTTFNWNTDTSGSFLSAVNWVPNSPDFPDADGVPDDNDITVFRRGSSASFDTVMNSSPTVDRLIVGSNSVTLDTSLVVGSTLTVDNPTTAETGRGLVIGELASDSAAVLSLSPPEGILNRFLVSLSAVAATLGDAAGSSGTLNVPGGVVEITGATDLLIGRFGTGALHVTNGGEVNVTAFGAIAVVGRYAGSTGFVTVSGGGILGDSSTLNVGGVLHIGSVGDGSLTITDGGTVHDTRIFAGVQAGATGSMIVDGAGSELTNDDQLFVGTAGNAFLTIRNSGKVNNTLGVIGDLPSSTGSVLVDGAGSEWISSGELVVGNFGTGSMAITNGGRVTSLGGAIGMSAGSTGSVVVDGAGSTWLIDNDTYDVTNGSLTITNHGVVARAGGGLTMGPVGLFVNQDGVLRGDGSVSWKVNNLGLVEPGTSTGVLTIAGNYEQNAAGWLRIELAGPTNYDQLLVSRDAALGGTLELVHQGGSPLQAGDSYNVLLTNTGAVSGQFSSVVTTSLAPGIDFSVSLTYGPTYVTAIVTSVEGIVGNYNNDGTVDAADYVVWRKNEGTTNVLPNDEIGGMIGPAHYSQWRAHFGEPAPGSGSGARESADARAAVPEAATWGLLAVVLAALRCRPPRRA